MSSNSEISLLEGDVLPMVAFSGHFDGQMKRGYGDFEFKFLTSFYTSILNTICIVFTK